MRHRALLTGRPGWAALAVGWAALAVAASVVSPPSGAGGLAATGPLGLVGVDKWVHALTYATLTGLLAVALRARTRRELLAAALVSAGVGAGVEVVQSTLPARSGDPADALANLVGATAAALVWTVALRLRARSRSG